MTAAIIAADCAPSEAGAPPTRSIGPARSAKKLFLRFTVTPRLAKKEAEEWKAPKAEEACRLARRR